MLDRKEQMFHKFLLIYQQQLFISLDIQLFHFDKS